MKRVAEMVEFRDEQVIGSRRIIRSLVSAFDRRLDSSHFIHPSTHPSSTPSVLF